MADYKEIRSDGFIAIKDEEFDLLRKLVYKHIGINLTAEKRTLLTGRLQKFLRTYKLTSFKEYYDFVINDQTGAALSELATQISTNHTFFGREKDHFDYFYTVSLPYAKKRHQAQNSKDLRVWCAGCSTGEESYTLLINMMEFLGAEYSAWNAGILATDISLRALDTAKNGVYTKDRVSGLEPKIVKKYFTDMNDGNFRVKDILKSETTFRRFNLMNETFPFKKQFDIIFCRNVMIYFDLPTRTTLVNKFYDLLVPGGFLFIGHSETIPRGTTKFEYVKPAIYRKSG